MIIAATGHRPDKLGGYDARTSGRLLVLATQYLAETKPSRVISGMALGWDQAFAQAAVVLCIPFTAAVPFDGQENKWPSKSQADYRHLLRQAHDVQIVCAGGYAASKMQKRNEWMVDNCDRIAALWNGTPGGTANCLAYAEQQERPVDNLWSRFPGGVFA